MIKRTVLALLLALLTIPMMADGRRFTLVIDAGHGGHDFGAPGAVTNEKTLTLRYALAFGRMVEERCPDVRVIYTRKRDVFIKLIDRAEIANRNKADLFMSFHINAVEGSRSARGFQTWTLGRGASTGNKGIMENLDVAKRENSVILMEKDYKQVYKGIDQNSAESDIMFEFIADKNRERSVELAKLMQREVCRATGRINAGAHQNNLAVLRLSSMPSCLLELGFISTPDEERFLNSDAALTLYTQGIFNAFLQYKMRFADKITVPYKADDSTPRALPQIVPDEYRKQQPAAPAPAAT
uniref:N-acetylmuramoyl-L-alanine amidase family protein n=1 Tax=Prevotella sp. TaxID=59823 RepID=UPI004025DA8D